MISGSLCSCFGVKNLVKKATKIYLFVMFISFFHIVAAITIKFQNSYDLISCFLMPFFKNKINARSMNLAS